MADDFDPVAFILDNNPSDDGSTDEFDIPGLDFSNETAGVFDDDEIPTARNPFKVDLSIKGFEPVEKTFQDTSTGVFDDPKYYKVLMGGEGQSAQRLHTLLSKYLTSKDPQDRVMYRQQIISAYWEFVKSLAPKMNISSTPMPKRMVLRYAVALPSLFTAEQKDMFSKAFFENVSGEPILYLDEWMQAIATGKLDLSATDEGPQRKSQMQSGGSAEQQYLMQLKSKNEGKLQSAESQLSAKESERTMVESELKSRIDNLCEHPNYVGLAPHKMTWSDAQRRLVGEIQDRLRALQKIDKELVKYLDEFQEAKEVGNSLDSKMADMPQEVQVDLSEIQKEMDTVRQMAKMTVGRKGNHFPVYSREFFHCLPNTTGFRENVIKTFTWIESIDPDVFVRIHKNQHNRIVPYTLLIPTYGDMGICWEPFNRYNRLTSRGRIAIPMYPRDLKIACLAAVADLRWQVAKAKAIDWTADGLTGQYYQWIESQKLKGDLKTYFIADYILWMTKESTGIQKLTKEVRNIFWRYIPFPQSLKDELGRRSPVYADLLQKDRNREMSDGY